MSIRSLLKQAMKFENKVGLMINGVYQKMIVEKVGWRFVRGSILDGHTYRGSHILRISSINSAVITY